MIKLSGNVHEDIMDWRRLRVRMIESLLKDGYGWDEIEYALGIHKTEHLHDTALLEDNSIKQ